MYFLHHLLCKGKQNCTCWLLFLSLIHEQESPPCVNSRACCLFTTLRGQLRLLGCTRHCQCSMSCHHHSLSQAHQRLPSSPADIFLYDEFESHFLSARSCDREILATKRSIAGSSCFERKRSRHIHHFACLLIRLHKFQDRKRSNHIRAEQKRRNIIKQDDKDL